jgi:hypothetical protein
VIDTSLVAVIVNVIVKIKIIMVVGWLLPYATAFAQPAVALPPEEPQRAFRHPSAIDLPRESQIEVPLAEPAMRGTAIGGYGELTVNAPSNGPAIVDLRRLVLYVGHNFNEHLRFYGELEVEHAVTSSDDRGEFEVEQAFLDYVQWRALNLRAGLILMPVGIINVYHEPPTFNGVDRPLTDQLIVPSTWREPGAGVFGEWRGFRYQAYAVNGFDASGFTASSGLREGHQEAQLALGKDWGIVMRLDQYFPFLLGRRISLDAGLSYYFANADQGRAQFGGHIPVNLVEADVRMKTRGLEVRAEIASVWIGGVRRLNNALLAAAQETAMPLMMPMIDGPVAHQLLGGYVEVGYDVLHPFRLRRGSQLVTFIRYEHVDTQLDLPADLARARGNRRDVTTAGLTFRPISEIALKIDYQHTWSDAEAQADASVDGVNVGLGFMF